MREAGRSAEDLSRQTDTCPDCIARDDVDVLGRPRKGRWGRIRDCAGCGGTTRIPRERADALAWWVSQKEYW